ncbi:uncharacterized protein B0H64DRAFT_452556 [Chaetomium fimeti]|uniref:Uncharacterized protein n=1 Tax=Chaetomium fimeti TaxID=1854472 RepID=A0AAE0H623_9PEZI|nr:hypothetical protein B0H64DRAFT_452556 [Chaetomium fimeti]
MDRIPNEIRMGIIRHLRGESDREALVAAYPAWKKIVERDDKLRILTIDERKRHGMPIEDSLALFESTGIRRRQFLEVVRVESFVVCPEYHGACCCVTADAHLQRDEFNKYVRKLFEGLHEITKRSVETGLKIPPFNLFIRARDDDLEGWTHCSGNHTDEEAQRALARARKRALDYEVYDAVLPDFKVGVDEVHFEARRRVHEADFFAVKRLTERLVGLRLVRFDFAESPFLTWEEQGGWRTDIVSHVEMLDYRLPIEEIHVHMGCRSIRNELKVSQPTRTLLSDLSELLFESLAKFPSLTVLRLSGQFSVGSSFFHLIPSNPFPALITFYLGIGPDTNSSSWFFVKDNSKHAWDKAASDPAWTQSVELTRAGIHAQDPLPGPEDEEKYEEYKETALAKEIVKRNRTLPHDGTLIPLLLGAARAAEQMPKIEKFSICLEDDFSGDDTPHPFVPPFLTRVFEMHFTRAPAGDANPTLTWKLGQKVDHWRPTDIVLDAWRAAARMRAGMELEISYIE